MCDFAKRVIKRFPENRDMQLVCLSVLSEFQCSRCQKTRKAKLVAVVSKDWNRLLCSGCYEKLLAEPSPVVEAPAESPEEEEER